MNQLRFDENLAIREVLDDIVGMVDRRERLIQSAGQMAEETRDERMAGEVKQLEVLMSDFLTLFEPVLVKVRAYAERLKQSTSESEAFLRSLVGIIDAGKTVDGTSATIQELEKDADEVQTDLDLANQTLDKIGDLFRKTRPYMRTEPAVKPIEPLKPSSEGLNRSGDHYNKTRPYVHAQPTARSQQSFQLSNETRDRISDLFDRTGMADHLSSSPGASERSADDSIQPRRPLGRPENKSLRPFVWAGPRSSTDQSS